MPYMWSNYYDIWTWNVQRCPGTTQAKVFLQVNHFSVQIITNSIIRVHLQHATMMNKYSYSSDKRNSQIEFFYLPLLCLMNVSNSDLVLFYSGNVTGIYIPKMLSTPHTLFPPHWCIILPINKVLNSTINQALHNSLYWEFSSMQQYSIMCLRPIGGHDTTMVSSIVCQRPFALFNVL